MSVQLKPNYINPLTMLKGNAQTHKTGQITTPKEKADKIKELEAKQQQLQNEMLLLKSNGSADGAISAKRQEEIENRIEEIADDIRSAKADSATVLSRREPDQDYYEKEEQSPFPAGIYQPEYYRFTGREIKKTVTG
ncbi:MAG TPA: hypothetical protein DF613_16125 [Lachnospiraceae bacterium]|nr:hypothetical protein [Lachnospiraceae bacterium]